MPPEDLVEALLKEEWWRQILSSLVICFFARGIYLPETVSRLLPVAGYDLSPDDLTTIGQAIHAEKFRYKEQEGFSFDTLRLPGRIFETRAPVSNLTEEYLRRGLAHARQLMARAAHL